ncbi:MAG: aldo/keto reductase [Planctomycetes bacterium]|nr:aldo/keto reductase [Planctomycetota bacterium]
MTTPTPPIRNQRAPMQYRRFGQTGQMLSVITLGGMRFAHGWDAPREQVPADTREECATMVRQALDAGVNHIETAHGYIKSETCYGLVLNDDLGIPRSRYHLMTKGAPATAEAARRLVDEQLRTLKTDHIDLYAWHGLNNAELMRSACAPGGPVEELLKLRDEGVIGAVGFSTHAPLEVICAAIQTGLFSFVNLHYYYFFQRNWAAIALAAARDLGVFIISPNDKGGQLFTPPELLTRLCAPLTPIQFNARFCLRTPHVHTLSFGMTAPAHVAEMLGTFPVQVPLSARDLAIQLALDARAGVDPQSAYEGWELMPDPSGINIPEVLRFRRLWKCYDMETFGFYRYNMLEAKGHWFPGGYATEEALAKLERSRWPAGVDVAALLRETHLKFHRAKG